MIRTLILIAAATSAIAACTPSSDDASSRPGGETYRTIDPLAGFEMFTLDNGLDVVLQVDRSDPIVAVTTVIHAGSNREKPGRTGFAHFFEHMAFNDSENVPRGWNRKAIPEWGGQRNGATWSDGTIYYEVVPRDAFDKILWVDSDRLGYMINTVTTDALEREKQVVKNEKRQNVDNRPYGYTGEITRKALYPDGHPYSWTVLGSLPDLQAATLDDLRAFHADWYGPNNATLAIVGDIDLAQTKAKVERWFGEIPRGRDVEKPTPQPVTLDTTKRLYFEDNFAKLPELRLTFPTVEDNHPDEVALNLLGALLGGSKSSPLYVEIVERSKFAPNVSAWHRASEIAGEFTIRVRALPGQDLDDVAKAVDRAFANFSVDEAVLGRIKAEQETSIYQGLSTVLGKSRNLATNNEFAGDPGWSAKVAAEVQVTTPAQIMKVFDRYLADKPHVVTSFVPKGSAELAVEGSTEAEVWMETVKTGVASEAVTAGAVADYTRTKTVHDRSEPPFGKLPLFSMPEVWERTLANDVVLRGITTDEVPLVDFSLTFEGGRFADTPDTAGRTVLLSAMMNEGTARRTAAEMEQAIGQLGSALSVNAGTDTLTVSGTSLSRNLADTVALAREIILSPRLDSETLDRERAAQLSSIEGSRAIARSVAGQVFTRLLHGADHPRGWSFQGEPERVAAFDLADMRDAHSKLLRSPATIEIVGDVSADEAQVAFAEVAQFINGARAERPENAAMPDGAPGVYFVDVPGAKQSVLQIGRLTVPTDDPDHMRLDFANEKLGGSIAGDLSQTLRIEKGYTYGAYSSVGQGWTPQPWSVRTSVRANATEASLQTIYDMLADYADNFDDDVVALSRNKVIKDNSRAYESRGAKLSLLRRAALYGLPTDIIERQQDALQSVETDDLRRVLKDYTSRDELVWLVVGDRETQLAPVQAFATRAGLGEVTELDVDGNRLDDG